MTGILSSFLNVQCLLCHTPIQPAAHHYDNRNDNQVSSPYLCQPCLNDLPYLQYHCPQCGQPLTLPVHTVCGRCQKKTPYVDLSFSLFQYQAPVDHLIKQLKFHHALPIANFFGLLLATHIKQQNTPLPDCITPIPLHPKRLRQRGYNQALEMAKVTAQALNIPLHSDLLKRSKYTRPQTECNVKERKKNLRNSFICTKQMDRLPASYQKIAIIDDVITTGTTINEAARALKRTHNKTVFAWSCAHS